MSADGNDNVGTSEEIALSPLQLMEEKALNIEKKIKEKKAYLAAENAFLLQQRNNSDERVKYLEESLTSLINLTASDNQLAFQEKLNEIKSFFSKNATQTLTGGQKLNLLHRELKKEQLRNKADGHMMSKIEPLINQTKMKMTEYYMDIHQLAKKIEILSNSETAIKVVEDNSKPEYKSIPRETHNQIVGIFNYIRESPEYLVDSLFRMYYQETSIENLTKIGRIIIGSLYRSAFYPSEERLLQYFLLEMCKYQNIVLKHRYDHGESVELLPLFRVFLISYIKFTIGLKDYLRFVLQDVIVKILQDSNAGNQIDKYASEIFQKILDNIAFIPVGIKLISKQIKTLAEESGFKKELVKNLTRELIFDNFFLLSFSDPSFYVAATGISNNSSLKNLDLIQKKLKQHLLAQDQMLVFNLDELVEVNLTLYQNNVIEDFQFYQSMIITKSEIGTLLEVLLQVRNNPQSNLSVNFPNPKLWDKEDAVGQILDTFSAEQKQLNITRYHRIHPSALVSLELPSKKKAFNNDSPKTDSNTKEIRKKLQVVLAEVQFLSPYKADDTISTIESLLNYSWSKNQASLLSHIHEILRNLLNLPSIYRENDYSLVFDQMFQDIQIRMQQDSQIVNETFYFWDQIQYYAYHLEQQRHQFLEYFTSLKIRYFQEFEEKKHIFLQDFLFKFSGKKSCSCSVMDKFTCDTCQAKSNSIKQFMQDITVSLKNNSLWKGLNEEQIKMAINQLERILMNSVYDFTFCQLDEDIKLRKFIDQFPSLDLDEFQVAPKYQNEAPWPFAQAELKKITSYKSPHDKLLCISRCWEVISSNVSLLEDPGPDSCWPIMIFVIYSSGNLSVFSNLQYINLYATLDEVEDSRLLAFRTVLKALFKISLEIPKKLSQDAHKENNPHSWYWPNQKSSKLQYPTSGETRILRSSDSHSLLQRSVSSTTNIEETANEDSKNS